MMHRTVWLLLGLGLLLGATGTASARILVIGDSNATGVGVRPSRVWPVILGRRLDEPVQVYGAPGASIANPSYGLGNDGTCVGHQAGFFGVSAAILALGTNDINSEPATVGALTSSLLAAIPYTRWVCLLPPPWSAEEARLAPVRQAIAAACEGAGAVLVDAPALLTRSSDLLDGKHLSVAGHRRIAAALHRVLEP